VKIQVGGETGGQHRWSCLSCGTMGPWTSQTIAVAAGEAHGDQHRDEAHGDQHRDEAHGDQHRDEDLGEILQNLKIPIQGDSPPTGATSL
jgi:hypothetical protein